MFFFFKQKTAYDMRISDWSSDVCSSDLGCSLFASVLPAQRDADQPRPRTQHRRDVDARRAALSCERLGLRPYRADARQAARPARPRARPSIAFRVDGARSGDDGGWRADRSEENTSELQSLMRISSAVFCLKKTKKI